MQERNWRHGEGGQTGYWGRAGRDWQGTYGGSLKEMVGT